MRNSLLFFLTLLSSSLVEVSIFSVFTYPFYLIKPTFIIGILFLQRLPAPYSILWFFLAPLFIQQLGASTATIIPHLLVGLIGAFLAARLFTRRSLYALIGLGVCCAILFVLFHTLSGIDLFDQRPLLPGATSFFVLTTCSLIILFFIFKNHKKYFSFFYS